MRQYLFFAISVCLMAGAAVQAGMAPSYLPTSDYYQGRRSFSENVGGATLTGHVEFAVYTCTQAEDAISSTGYEGSAAYVYAYQVFNYQQSDAAMTYFAVTGVDPTTVSADSIDAMESYSPDGGSRGFYLFTAIMTGWPAIFSCRPITMTICPCPAAMTAATCRNRRRC